MLAIIATKTARSAFFKFVTYFLMSIAADLGVQHFTARCAFEFSNCTGFWYFMKEATITAELLI
jgi:hypothetical protein